MTKLELVKKVSEKTGKSQRDMNVAVDTIFETIKEVLENGDKITFIGFGTFEVVERAARETRNPKTGEKLMIDACKAPKFKASKALKETIKKMSEE